MVQTVALNVVQTVVRVVQTLVRLVQRSTLHEIGVKIILRETSCSTRLL